MSGTCRSRSWGYVHLQKRGNWLIHHVITTVLLSKVQNSRVRSNSLVLWTLWRQKEIRKLRVVSFHWMQRRSHPRLVNLCLSTGWSYTEYEYVRLRQDMTSSVQLLEFWCIPTVLFDITLCFLGQNFGNMFCRKSLPRIIHHETEAMQNNFRSTRNYYPAMDMSALNHR